MRKSRHNSYFIPFLLAALVLLLYSSLLATPALAGIKFAPFEAIRVDVAPGETITHKMTVTLVETDQPVDMVVDVMGFGNSPDGSAQELEASKDTSLYSALVWDSWERSQPLTYQFISPSRTASLSIRAKSPGLAPVRQ